MPSSNVFKKYSQRSEVLVDNGRTLDVSQSFHSQFAELSNLHTHLTLRSLRPANSRIRVVSHGYGFSLISCPSYFFEMLTWTVVTMTGTIAAAVFLIVSTTQMALRAIEKHKNEEFGKEHPRERYAMIPSIP
ncbi:hypothetical protein C0995_004474 [Termitomyces sp. Mi166|nr:hypothetical protein C0995_004474 [Termitomyces sp. Mi166\